MEILYFALFVFVIRRCINVVVMATEVCTCCDMPIYTVTTLSKDESIDYQNEEKHIIKDVTLLLSKIADKSDRLINNSTTNLAESWMHIRTTFDGGKSDCETSSVISIASGP
jgi:hypothetical protein